MTERKRKLHYTTWRSNFLDPQIIFVHFSRTTDELSDGKSKMSRMPGFDIATPRGVVSLLFFAHKDPSCKAVKVFWLTVSKWYGMRNSGDDVRRESP